MAGTLRALVCATVGVLCLSLAVAAPAGGEVSASSTATSSTASSSTASSSTAGSSTAGSSTAGTNGLLERIRRMGIVTRATELRNPPRGTRFFRITVAVPVDHAQPDGPAFELRVNLLHRGFARPMVVETSGYRLWDSPYRSEVTHIVDGNQLDIEHRFFAPSLPDQPDWETQLTIRQVADDHHRVITAFRHLYEGRWLSTGDSKGGMAATYHRRFYPGDVAATIAYVAPNDAIDDQDAYPAFLARVGGPRLADCRDRLVALQRRALHQRGWFRARLAAHSSEHGLTWNYLGGVDVGLEASVIDFYFAFWQYWGAAACRTVPVARRITNAHVWRYLDSVNPWTNLSDQRRFYSLPYHYQAASQIGGPQPFERRLRDLLRYPGADTPANILPAAMKPVPKDSGAMRDIDGWVRTAARRMLFVDGQLDPWAAEPFRCGTGARERGCQRVVVPRGTHGVVIADLPRRVRIRTWRLVRRWAGVRSTVSRTTSPYDGARWVPELDGRYLEYVRGGRRSGVEPARGSDPVVRRRATGLRERIERLGIVDAVRELPRAAPPGARFFRIWLRLPVDHTDPDGPRFRLRATLLHRKRSRPMVLATSGYGLSTWQRPYPSEVTWIVGGNQLNVEHRFFLPSRPADPDWATQLTIRQSATDQHRVVRAFQRIYRQRWISTGASKGGMTMTYHRRFFPADVDGTVAYVAPNDAVDSADGYGDFLATVGGAEHGACRAALVAVQRRILGTDRDWFRSRLSAFVEDSGAHLGLVDSADHGLEVAAVELPFAFWQSQLGADACPRVPGDTATRGEVWRWIDDVFGWAWVTDEMLSHYLPYYYQAATQLGAPAPYEEPVADLLLYPGYDVPGSFVPDDLKPLAFDPAAMADVDAWVRTGASRMFFLYGEHDPWSAEPFACGTAGRDRQCLRRFVPDWNHSAGIRHLPGDARRAAIARIRRWAGVDGSTAAVGAAERRVRQAEPALASERVVPAG